MRNEWCIIPLKGWQRGTEPYKRYGTLFYFVLCTLACTHTHTQRTQRTSSPAVRARERSISYRRVLEMLWRSDEFDLFTFGRKQGALTHEQKKKKLCTLRCDRLQECVTHSLSLAASNGTPSTCNRVHTFDVIDIYSLEFCAQFKSVSMSRAFNN